MSQYIPRIPKIILELNEEFVEINFILIELLDVVAPTTRKKEIEKEQWNPAASRQLYVQTNNVVPVLAVETTLAICYNTTFRLLMYRLLAMESSNIKHLNFN
uniref:Uncharacterized protein n=1 Tax=Glossina austeni TaxID=7395 RepID=A0A1A9VNU1_GLOAU